MRGSRTPFSRVASQPVRLHRCRQHLGEHLVGVADTRRRQLSLNQGGQPLADQQHVDAGQRRPLERREDLVVQELPVATIDRIAADNAGHYRADNCPAH